MAEVVEVFDSLVRTIADGGEISPASTFNAIESMVPGLPVKFVKSVPVDECDWNLYLSQYAKSLTIEFIGLDSLLDVDNKH